MRGLVTGATGFIGRKLVSRLERPAVLARDPESARRALGGAVEAFAWDALAAAPPSEAFRGVEAVFHLAGEPVAEGRWNSEKKDRILQSRVRGTRALVDAIEKLPEKERPRAFISASAVGYYGNRGDDVLDESAPPGEDFLAGVCRAWEAEAERAETLGVRVVRARIGVVLGPDGGALPRMLLPFKLGLGGRVGFSGKQWMPWIHRDDVVGLLLHAAATPDVRGPMNTVAPEPVRNRDFTRALGAALRRPTLFPAPKLGLRLLFGEFAQILFDSQRAVPRVAEKTGYRFQFATIADGLRAALG